MKKQLILALTLSVFVLTRCEEGPTVPSWKNNGGAKPISISSFYPESGEGGIVVTIFAENFTAVISDTFVTFDGTKADVLQVQPGMITVRVPLSLVQGDYQVAVSAQNQTATSLTTFRVNDTGESS